VARALVGHHADRQQDADRPGQAQFVSDTVELDHVDDPKFSEAHFPEAEVAPRRNQQPARAAPKSTGSVAGTG